MTRQDQVSLPTRQQPLSDRVYLAEGSDPRWRKTDETWQEWCAWLPRRPTTEIYLMLRGAESFRSLRELARLHQTTDRTLLTILYELARLRLIKLEREHGTILSITVNDPPPVPKDIDAILRTCSYNHPPDRRSDVAAFITYWRKHYLAVRKTAYHVAGKDRPQAGKLIRSIGLAEAERTAWYLLYKGVGADVLARKNVTLASFVEQYVRIRAEKAEDEQPGPRVR